ncbi:hypothetical protein QJS10_CPB20g00270 [Acorus calamus]|uniref:Macro domain-containing protein n=1 Tax=Acorus calamus TaxID=4465 RepID=A0AAV9CA45_ACOCL|nr:hypothetical protein QJS10_CPB20g00270 [Acorus calamus]
MEENPAVQMDADSSKEVEGGTLGKQVVVMMVGAPGSGKSTFCNDVVSRGPHRLWHRVCQDSIANGKAGTKLQCLRSASDALKDGKSVFIDRCNLDREQRVEFVKLGSPQVDVHAVVLDLPARVCISRSVKRTDHEGNLQGGKAAAVVNRMLQKKEFPKLNEGFSRITFCQNDNDVQSAVDTYRALGPSESLPSGYFGQKGSKEKDTQCMETETIQINNKKAAEGGKRGDSVGGDISSNSLHTLAFPSISTADFQFNHVKASDIIVESIDEALNKFKNIRLAMVDLSSGSHILSLVKDKAVKKKLDPLRFFTFAGNITLINTEGNLGCTVIANATNWRLKPGGGGVNAAIFSAGGEALKLATKEQAGTISPGKSLVVPLPSTSPLFEREGITHVIHVLGPNMNPERPNYLKNDYVKGCKILCEAYSSLFENFALVVHAQRFQKESCNSSESGASYSHKDHTPRNSIDKLFRVDPKNKREDCLESLNSVRNKKYKALPLERGLNDERDTRHNDFAGCGNHGDGSVILEHNENMTSCSDITSSAPQVMIQNKNKKLGDSSTKNWSSWAQALHHTAMNPEKHKDNIMHISDDVVVLNDLYPKVPSMRQLHLHVISQEFDSIHLKNKKHWNSFNTAFFRDSVDVIKEIDEHGMAMVA